MSGGKKTRRQQAIDTKVHIFNTAVRLLEQQEFDSITVRDIVCAANVSVGCFYNYYSTKLDVYYETYFLADEYFDSTVSPALEGLDFEPAVYLYFDYYARYSFEITSLSLTKVLYNSKNKCFDRRLDRGMMPVLVQVVQRALDSGRLSCEESAQDIALFFLIAVRGQIYNWCTNDGSYDLREAMRKYVSKLLRAYI